MKILKNERFGIAVMNEEKNNVTFRIADKRGRLNGAYDIDMDKTTFYGFIAVGCFEEQKYFQIEANSLIYTDLSTGDDICICKFGSLDKELINIINDKTKRLNSYCRDDIVDIEDLIDVPKTTLSKYIQAIAKLEDGDYYIDL